LQVQSSGKFRIETIGANGHICELGGAITNGKSQLEKSACQVNFKAEGQTLTVATNDSDACKDFCGARSWFEGVYRKPPPFCVSKNVETVRKKFKQEYLAKNYSAALALINPVATQCKPFLFWIDAGRVLNDLALTQFKLDDRAGCIRTLQGLAKDAAMSDEEVRGNFPPTDADMYLPVVRATRTNLRLCTKK
ncbi:MAG: hypothetical protein O9353_06160, partial [Bacteroidia bacterium]|nr:hypothetical protein [Bacteroidia bacterium]